MTILDEIIKEKRSEVYLAKKERPLNDLEAECVKVPPCKKVSSKGIIAEMKRRSPSKGALREFKAGEIAREYETGGAAAISVLTDKKYFSGSLEDLVSARLETGLPLLRKEFVIDRYQIAEARVYGADIILLIASVLTPQEIFDFYRYAKDLGLDVLVEVHNEEEINALPDLKECLIGINNRDLKTFDVDITHSERLAGLIPEYNKKVAESGIHSPHSITQLMAAGFEYFLIGERFMKASSPGEECRRFIKESGLAD